MPRLFPSALLLGLALVLVGATATRADDATIDEALRDLRSHWLQVRTPSVRVYCDPSRRPTRAALEGLEGRVQRLCADFGVEPRVRASLLRWPIEYVLTADTDLIDDLTGIEAEGAAFASRRLILATELPHEHELVHVIVHLALGTRWSGNVSFLEEGLASAIGGHAGEAPTAVMVTADEVLARGPVPFERLLTERGFDEAPFTAQERYALAARFVDHLLRARGGWPRFRELLLILAGDPAEVRKRPVRATVVQIEGVYDIGFDALVAEFLAWTQEHPAIHGLREDRPARPVDATARDTRHRLDFWEEDGTWVLEVGALWGTLGAQIAWGEPLSPQPAWNASANPIRQYELEVRRTGARLVDRTTDRLLMRWEPVDLPLRRVARLRLDARELGLQRPTTWSVWSRPDVPRY